MADIDFDSKLDLKIERVLDVPRSLIWQAWVKPEHLKEWFCPKPWSVTQCEIDLRPGGLFRTVMKSPEGEEFANDGCYLEVIPESKLVWTSALLPGFRPAAFEKNALPFTGFLLLEDHGQGAKYTALARHADPATNEKHREMGFESGWNTSLDQLIEYMSHT